MKRRLFRIKYVAANGNKQHIRHFTPRMYNFFPIITHISCEMMFTKNIYRVHFVWRGIQNEENERQHKRRLYFGWKRILETEITHPERGSLITISIFALPPSFQKNNQAKSPNRARTSPTNINFKKRCGSSPKKRGGWPRLHFIPGGVPLRRVRL